MEPLTHLRPRNLSAFHDDFRFRSEERWFPQNQIRKLPDLQICEGFKEKLIDFGDWSSFVMNLNRSNEVAHAVTQCRVDGVLGDVAPHSNVVVLSFLVSKTTTKALHLVSRLPRASNHLSNATHRLTNEVRVKWVKFKAEAVK